MKRILLLALLLLAFALTFTACGKDDITTEATANTTTAVSTTEDPRLAGAYDTPEDFITLPALKDVVVQNSIINEKVQAEIDALLPELGKTAYVALPAGTAAITGNVVNIYYTGRAKDPNVSLSEDNLKGMSNADDETGYDLLLGSGSFIDGFEDQLIGAKKGDTIAVDVSFPEDYGNDELNGLAVIFDVTVNEVYEAKITDQNEVSVYVSYTLVGEEPNTNLSYFLYIHEASLTMSDLSQKFDEFFDAQPLYDALLGKSLLDEITLTLILDREGAEEFGYDKALTLTATITIYDILTFPTELTDEDINSYTGGLYPTAQAFREYLFDYFKVEVAYDTLTELAVYKDIPTDVFEALYEGYYDASIYTQIGDVSQMTEDELASVLTDEVKATADSFATENATAEWKDTMLVAYLEKAIDFVFTDEMYQAELQELYEYYCTYEAFLLYYYGIDSIEKFEAAFGEDYLRVQFKNNSLLNTVAEKVSYQD